MNSVHKSTLRQERGTQESKDCEAFLSHLNSTLSTVVQKAPETTTRKGSEETKRGEEEEHTFRRFNSDSATIGIKRRSVYDRIKVEAKKSGDVDRETTTEIAESTSSSSSMIIGEHENLQSNYAHTALSSVSITYKKTATTARKSTTPKKSENV